MPQIPAVHKSEGQVDIPFLEHGNSGTSQHTLLPRTIQAANTLCRPILEVASTSTKHTFSV